MEKHGRLIQCIQELRQMLLTPIKPYSPLSENDSENSGESSGGKKTPPRKSPEKPRQESGDDEDEERPGSPTSPPNAQHSSSDGGSDLEELLAKDFPHEDLPSLITRAMGKGNNVSQSWVWPHHYLCYYFISLPVLWLQTC